MINDFFNGGGAETVFRDHLRLFENSKKIDVDSYYGSKEYCHAKNLFSYLFSLRHKNELELKLNSYKPDIIHLHGYYHILSPSIFLAIRKYKKDNPQIKVFYTAHDYHFLYPNSSWLKYVSGNPIVASKFGLSSLLLDSVDHRGWRYSLVKKAQWIIAHKIVRIIKDIDFFISPSIFLKQKYESSLRMNVSLIRNPVSLSSSNRPLKISKTEPIKLVYFGRIAKEKGIVEFVTKLTACQALYSLDIYGSGDEKERLESLISSHRLGDKVKTFGVKSHSELMSLLPKYHAMVIPSLWYENAPMSIVEAANAGLCVIGTNIGGVAEMAQLCSNYVLFDPDNYSVTEILEELVNLKLADNRNRLEVFDTSYYHEEMIKLYS